MCVDLHAASEALQADDTPQVAQKYVPSCVIKGQNVNVAAGCPCAPRFFVSRTPNTCCLVKALFNAATQKAMSEVSRCWIAFVCCAARLTPLFSGKCGKNAGHGQALRLKFGTYIQSHTGIQRTTPVPCQQSEAEDEIYPKR